MSDLVVRLKSAANRRLRGPVFTRILRRLDIDPRRYWLLMDLFHKLSTREEMQGQLGRQTKILRFSAILSAIMSALAAAAFIFVGGTSLGLAALSLGLTVFTLVGVLLSEAANSLVNPDEALALTHQPINGATYTGAKLSHLLNIVVYYVLGWNFLPSLATLFLKDGRWFYPLLHLFVALMSGLVLALLCCSIFGVVMRLVPARRMKSAAQFIQAIPGVLFVFIQFSPAGTARRMYGVLIVAMAPLANVPAWLLVTVFIFFATVVTVAGLRSLSRDYLIQASSLVHGRANAANPIRRSLLGGIVRRSFGGQVGRAGFDYVKRMMLRDWQFRRHILGILPITVLMTVGILSAGLASPFSRAFTSTHFIPHILGFFLSMLCLTLPYGNDYKGIWLFLLVSDRALARFARGVHGSLWLAFVAVPHALLFPLFVWLWGIANAVPFTVYSVAVATAYLGVALRSIRGIPFGRQGVPQETQGSEAMTRIFLFMIVALISIGLQYLLYRSITAVWIGTALIGALAVFLTRRSLHTFHVTMMYHLSVASRTSTMIYKEVGEDEAGLKIEV